MPISVQLDLEAEVAASIESLVRRIFPDPAIETILRLGEVPHLTLGIYDDPPIEAFVAGAAAFARDAQYQSVTLESLGIFPGEKSVLYLGPVVTSSLVTIHHRFHEAMNGLGFQCWDHYRPGHWVPHVTLAVRLDGKTLGAAIEAAAANWHPLSGRFDALRTVRFRPVETIYHKPLG